MLKYIVKRILQMIPMMIILSIVVFCMVRLIPGDPVTMSLGMGAGKDSPPWFGQAAVAAIFYLGKKLVPR